MRNEYIFEIKTPEGVACHYANHTLKFKKGNVELERKINIIGTEIKVENDVIKFISKKANKKHIAAIKSAEAHIKNILLGLGEKFVYEMEICNVHFPITVKVEKDKILINNFLGEKLARTAKVLPHVEIKVDGKKIVISGHDIEKTGQTVANIEKATKISKRDRRIFQDGIFITSRPGAEK